MKRLMMLIILISLSVACSKPQVVVAPPAVATTVEAIDDYKFEAAAIDLDERLAGGEDSNWVDYGHGLIAERQLQFHDAINRYYSILDRNEDFALAHVGLARAFLGLDLPLKAMQAAEEYVDLSGYGGDAGIILAIACVAARDYEKAREVLDKAVSAGADKIVARLIKARSMYLEGDFDAAYGEVESAVSGGLETAESFTEAANALETFGFHDSSMTLSRKAHEVSGGSSKTMVSHLQRATRLNYLYEASQYLGELKERDKQARLAWLMESLYLLQDEHFLDAVQSLSEYRRTCGPTFSPPFYDFKVRLAASDVVTGQLMLEEVGGSLDRMQHGPTFEQFMTEELFWGFLDIKLEANAGSRFDNFEHISEGSTEWEWMRAYIMAKFGATDMYNESVDKLLDRFDEDPGWMTRIADISAYDEGLMKEHAERLYHQVLEKRPTFYPAFEGLITMLVDEDRFADAHTVCETYAPIVSNSAVLAIEHAIISVRTGRVDQGLRLFNDNIEMLKANHRIYDRMLRALEGKNALNGIEQVLDKMTSLNEDNPIALIRASEWWADLNDLTTAMELIEQVQQIDPDNLSAKVQMARVTFEMGDKDRGLSMFDSLYKAVASEPELALYYSRALATEKKDMANAKNLARGAVVAGRNLLKSWYNLCWVYIQDGEYAKAAGKAYQSSQMYPLDPVGFYWLGKSRYLEGKDEAREHLQRAIELGIWGDYLTDTQQMLAKLN